MGRTLVRAVGARGAAARRGRAVRATGTLAATAAIGFATPTSAHAHAAFFADHTTHLTLAAALTGRNVAVLAVAIACAAAMRWLATIAYRPHARRCALRWVCERLAALAPATSAVPVIARLALAATLLFAAGTGTLLAPNVALAGSAAAAIATVQVLVAVALVVGIATRAAAVAVFALLAYAGTIAGPAFVLGRMDIAGLAAFVVVVGGRPLDVRIPGWQLSSLALGAWVLRIGVATGLAVTAFTEKLVDPAVTAAVLQRYPAADPSTLLPIDQASLIVVLAGVELLFAALVLLLPLPEITMLVVGAPFALTVLVFGPVEIGGHLPVYGAAAVLVLLAVHPQAGRVVNRLLPTVPEVATVGWGLEPAVGERYAWAAATGQPAATPAPAPAAVPATAAFALRPWADVAPVAAPQAPPAFAWRQAG